LGKDTKRPLVDALSAFCTSFHMKVVNSPMRDAMHLLDGLLYREAELRTEEHHTDTAGFTDHVFALCQFLWVRVRATQCGLPGKNRWRARQGRRLAGTVVADWRVNRPEANRTRVRDVVRLAASIQQGAVMVSIISPAWVTSFYRLGEI
jgi:TnpA family transposase